MNENQDKLMDFLEACPGLYLGHVALDVQESVPNGCLSITAHYRGFLLTSDFWRGFINSI
jgi:hypothetical protein